MRIQVRLTGRKTVCFRLDRNDGNIGELRISGSNELQNLEIYRKLCSLNQHYTEVASMDFIN